MYNYDDVVCIEFRIQLLFAGLSLMLLPFVLLYSGSVSRIAVTINYLNAQSEHLRTCAEAAIC